MGIEYRTHVSNVGWQNVVTDGQTSGDESQSNWIEAIQVKLSGDKASDYDIYYRSHVAEMGWLDWAKNGELSGTQGYAYAVQAIQIVLVPKGSSAPGKTLVPFKTGTVICSIRHISRIQAGRKLSITVKWLGLQVKI